MLAQTEYNITPDREAEEAIIACCLSKPEAPKRMLALVGKDDMLTPEGKQAYSRIEELVDAGEEVNIWTLSQGGLSREWLYDVQRGNVTVGGVTLDYWCEFLQRQARARYVISRASHAITAITDGKHPDDVAYELASGLREQVGTQQSRTRSLMEVLEEDGYPLMLDWMRNPKQLAGPSTGLAKLDIYLGGLGSGRLIALGADTGIGKSAFVQHLARACATEGTPVHVISTEMSDIEVFFRMAFMTAGWDKLEVAKRGHVREVERTAMLDALDALQTVPIYLTELRGQGIDWLESEIGRVREQFRTEVVILDLLNGLPVLGDNRAQGIAVNTARLKQTAERHRVCLLMTAHINRESAKGIADLGPHSFKDSGSIEADADQVLILVPTDDKGQRMPREEVARIANNGNPIDVAIRICKNRHGAEGTIGVRLNWGHGGRFYPVDAA